jgi:hypothetical protein
MPVEFCTRISFDEKTGHTPSWELFASIECCAGILAWNEGEKTK